MYLPDRIRIECDNEGRDAHGNPRHPWKNARVTDLDTGQEVKNIRWVRLDLDERGLRAEVDYYDEEAFRHGDYARTIAREYDQPDVVINVIWLKPPDREQSGRG